MLQELVHPDWLHAHGDLGLVLLEGLLKSFIIDFIEELPGEFFTNGAQNTPKEYFFWVFSFGCPITIEVSH